MRLWPYIFCCHACSFNFSSGRRACQPSPNLNENRTTQFCHLIHIFLILLFSPSKDYPDKGPMQITTLNVPLYKKHEHLPAGLILVGHQPSIKAIKSDKSSLRQSWGGLVALVPRDHPTQLLLFQSEWRHLERIYIPLWIPSDDGRSGFVVLNCYLPSGQSVIDEREFLMSDIFSCASIFDISPTMIGGDLQYVPEDSSVLIQVLASNRWSDFYSDSCRSRNLEPETTYSGNGWASDFRDLRKNSNRPSLFERFGKISSKRSTHLSRSNCAWSLSNPYKIRVPGFP